MKDVIAFPVPFNPKKQNRLEISGVVFTGSIKVVIFDINGDIVIKKRGSQFPVYWNGRNGSGRYVKPGLYIIRVVAENDSEYGKKNIRILVNY